MNFKEIRLIRLLLWVLFYLVALFLSIFAVVVPVVKSYKEVRKSYIGQKHHYEAMQREHDSIFRELKGLQAKYRKMVDAFENRWEEESFVREASRYFSRVVVTQLEINASDPTYKIYEIDARTNMASPQNFYRFVEHLPNLPNVIRIDFPIVFRAVGTDEIEGIFRIRVYEERKPSAESNASRQPETKR